MAQYEATRGTVLRISENQAHSQWLKHDKSAALIEKKVYKKAYLSMARLVILRHVDMLLIIHL